MSRCEAAFGTDDMNDSVFGIEHTEVGKSEFLGIAGQCIDLFTGNGVFDRFVLIMCRRVVVGHAVYMVGTETFQSPCT